MAKRRVKLRTQLQKAVRKSGKPLTHVSKESGIDYATLHLWLNDNARGRSRPPRLAEDQVDSLAKCLGLSVTVGTE